MRKRAKPEKTETPEQRYQSVIKDQTDFVVKWKPDGTRTFVNDAYCRYLGLSREEAVGTSFFPLISEEYRAAVISRFSLITPEVPALSGEHKIIRPDGSIKWNEWTDFGIFDDKGRVVEFQSVGRDITERKSSEEALRKEKETAQKYLDIVGVMVVAIKADQTVSLINQKGCEIIGLRERDIIGKNWFDNYVPERLRDQVIDVFDKLIAGKIEPVEYYENPVLTSSGGERIISWHNSVLKDERGKIIGALSSGQDITERKKAIEELKRSEEKYHSLILNIPDITWITDREGRATFISPNVKDIYGYTPEEMIKSGERRWFRRIHPEDIALVKGKYNMLFDKGGRFDVEYRVKRKDGQWIWLRDRAVSTFEKEGRQYVYGIFTDITERKRAAEKLNHAYEEIKNLKEQLEAENIYLREEVIREGAYKEIIGSSKAIQDVLKRVDQVAHTESNVLITGETGTGKELIARAIHQASARRNKVLVMVNCAAIPSTLIESELFGREKGAYTGALTSQAGRFEIADKATLLLDEVGDLPLELQAKLLRVLQDGEFERLGSTRTIRVDVRFLAATNSDLEKAVEEGAFRSDLYYRINVFPIHVPPLRERKEDILPLTWFVIKKLEKKMGKRIKSISKKSIQSLQRYSWPGNVRELFNIIERAMILTRDSTLHPEIPADAGSMTSKSSTLGQVEKDHIVSVLNMTGWRIRGKQGAAEVLGLKPTTLEARMKKMSIKRL